MLWPAGGSTSDFIEQPTASANFLCRNSQADPLTGTQVSQAASNSAAEKLTDFKLPNSWYSTGCGGGGIESIGALILRGMRWSRRRVCGARAGDEPDVARLPSVDSGMVKLVETAEDVLEELGPLAEVVPAGDDGREVHHPAELALNELEQQILAAVPCEPTTVDAVIAAANLPVPQVLATLSAPEMRHLIGGLARIW